MPIRIRVDDGDTTALARVGVRQTDHERCLPDAALGRANGYDRHCPSSLLRAFPSAQAS